ncbi:hypothetical protein PACTADRAFT_32378 [Pachysolen tannophilus NRRL Y-2460]|uniref:UBX domain-containing protein n=1 Tax=Pachysolen tannophilus NRRL Y-2460 TaxID=669874 RepID=A0A1E4TYX7_PACTA|nr:hypothetical protein PACTADRAFT_32378 [Pachysolen tannophilus NRRL Y-2460]
MTSLTVQYNLKAYRSKSISGSTPLNDVLIQSCQYFHLNSDEFGLKHGNNFLDLSLPIRLLNLAQGTKLTLAKVSSAAEKEISLKLIVVENASNAAANVNSSNGINSILKVKPSEKIIDILLKYEKSLQYQLINRVENGIKYRPVLQIYSKIISSEEDMGKSLKSFGVTSNAVMRLSFEKKIGEIFLNEVKEVDLKTNNVENEIKKITNQTSSTNETEISEEKDVLNNEVEKDILAQNEAKYGDDQQAPRQIKLSNDVKIFKPEQIENFSFEDKDEDFEMSVDDFKKYQGLIQKRGLSEHMKKKLQKNNKNQNQTKNSSISSSNCHIRIKFPDLSILELKISKIEKIGKIYEILKTDYLNDQYFDADFKLYQSFPFINLNDFKEIPIREKLNYDKILLIFDTNGIDKNLQSYLKPNLKADILDYNIHGNDSQISESNTPGQEGQETNSSVRNDLLSAPTNNNNNKQQQQQQQQDASQKKENITKTMPKWFKIGKK